MNENENCNENWVVSDWSSLLPSPIPLGKQHAGMTFGAYIVSDWYCENIKGDRHRDTKNRSDIYFQYPDVRRQSKPQHEWMKESHQTATHTRDKKWLSMRNNIHSHALSHERERRRRRPLHIVVGCNSNDDDGGDDDGGIADKVYMNMDECIFFVFLFHNYKCRFDVQRSNIVVKTRDKNERKGKRSTFGRVCVCVSRE